MKTAIREWLLAFGFAVLVLALLIIMAAGR